MKSYIITQDGISLFINGKMYSAEASHPNYGLIKQAIIDDKFETIPALINLAEAVKTFAVGSEVEVNVDHGVVTYKGETVRGYCVDRIIEMKDEGFNIKPMTAYLDRLMKNPSKRAVDELHGFNEYGRMPITEDGYFIAYKRISGWMDTHSRTVLNKPAHLMDEDEKATLPYTTDLGVTVELVDGITTISMARNKVDDRSENTCSEGLHFCSQEYLKSFSGDKIVVLKIDPADVVSIPVDYNNTKGRCARYQVIDVLSQEDFNRAMGVDVFVSPVYTEFVNKVDEIVSGVEVPKGEKFEGEDDGIEYDFTAGYVRGYADGRKGCDNSVNFAGQGADGYAEGRSDGKGHKPKKFK